MEPQWFERELAIGILASSLGWMFVIAGAIKVRHPWLASLAMVDFRVARAASRRNGLIHGLGEVIIGVWLVSGIAPTGACVVAATALTGFTALIVRSLIHGDQFPCRCFGDGDSELSSATALRTVALAGLAWVAAVGSFDLALNTRSESARLLIVVAGGALTVTTMLVASIPKLLRWNSLRGYVSL